MNALATLVGGRINVTDGTELGRKPSKPSVGADAKPMETIAESGGSELFNCTVDPQGYVLVKTKTSTLVMTVLALLGLAVYFALHGHAGMEDRQIGSIIGLTTIGLMALYMATANAASAFCLGRSTGSSDSGSDNEGLKLAFCSVGITLSFLFYGYVLEWMTKGGRTLPEGIGILSNSVCYVFVSRLALKLSGKAPAKLNLQAKRQFIKIAMASKLATFLTWRALRYVNFPTQVLAKSAKSLPIMIVNTMRGGRPALMQWVSVLLITAGTVVFMLFKEGMDDVTQQQTSMIGGGLLLFALFCDGLTGTLEDEAIKAMEWKHGQGTFDLMYWINYFACPFAALYILLSGEIGLALTLSMEDCKAMAWLSLAGALGQMCIFYTIANFGALVCSIITTMRKVLQIALSVAAFGHAFNQLQIAGLVMSFVGVGVNMLHKSRKKTASQVTIAVPKAGIMPPNYDDNYLAATRSSV